MKIIFEMDKKEVWKQIKKYPAYKISNLGRIKRIKSAQATYIGKILKSIVDPKGYLRVFLYRKGRRKQFLVHRLVARAFIGPCPKDKEVNHKDGNTSNPHVDNLEYISCSENHKHAFKIGLRSSKGEENGRSKLIEKDIKKIRRLYRSGKYMQKEIAEKFGINRSHVSNIVREEKWPHI